MLPEITLSMRPNNQITIGLQNVYRKPKDSYQNRYWDKHQYEKEVEGKIFEKMPIAPFWKGALLRERIKESKFRETQKSKWEKTCINIGSYFQKIPPLDIIPKFQRELKLKCCTHLGWLALKKIIQILIHFSEYRLSRAKHFGNVQAQKIFEAGAAMDMLCNGRPEFAHITTLTLAGSTEKAFDCIAARSGYITNRLWEPIRKRYGKDIAWYFVWEYQKRGALHLHISHYHPDATEGMLIGNMLIEQWHKILNDISEESGIDMFEPLPNRKRTFYWQHQHHTQPAYKSVAAYFAKYAAKAKELDENHYVRKFSKTRPPTRFWGSSKEIKKLIDANSFSFNLDGIPSQSHILFDELMEVVLSKQITLFDEYEWKLEIRKPFERIGKKDMNPLSKPVRFVGVEKRVISEGLRKVFYVSPSDYQSLLIALPQLVGTFGDF